MGFTDLLQLNSFVIGGLLVEPTAHFYGGFMRKMGSCDGSSGTTLEGLVGLGKGIALVGKPFTGKSLFPALLAVSKSVQGALSKRAMNGFTRTEIILTDFWYLDEDTIVVDGEFPSTAKSLYSKKILGYVLADTLDELMLMKQYDRKQIRDTVYHSLKRSSDSWPAICRLKLKDSSISTITDLITEFDIDRLKPLYFDSKKFSSIDYFDNFTEKIFEQFSAELAPIESRILLEMENEIQHTKDLLSRYCTIDGNHFFCTVRKGDDLSNLFFDNGLSGFPFSKLTFLVRGIDSIFFSGVFRVGLCNVIRFVDTKGVDGIKSSTPDVEKLRESISDCEMVILFRRLRDKYDLDILFDDQPVFVCFTFADEIYSNGFGVRAGLDDQHNMDKFLCLLEKIYKERTADLNNLLASAGKKCVSGSCCTGVWPKTFFDYTGIQRYTYREISVNLINKIAEFYDI